MVVESHKRRIRIVKGLVKMHKMEKKDRRRLKVINGESDRKVLYKLLLTRAKIFLSFISTSKIFIVLKKKVKIPVNNIHSVVKCFLATFEEMGYGNQPINEMFSSILDLKIYVFTEQF